ncbi:MAG: hypothetical protein RLY49_7 [Candidatus Parcubacteria bacterium]|jgi:hypothetical protein
MNFPSYTPAIRPIDDFRPQVILLESPEVCELLNRFLRYRENGKITRDCVRQIFMPIAKELICKFSPSGLGIICAWSQSHHNHREDYRDASLVTKGTNAWSAIFLDPSDSGVIMTQKIATASLLSKLTELAECSLAEECQGNTITCTPLDILSADEITGLKRRHTAVSEKLKW